MTVWQAAARFVKRKLKENTLTYLENCRDCGDGEYLLALLKLYTAPTVFAAKTGTLVNLNAGGRDLYRCWRCNDSLRKAIPLAYLELENEKGTPLLYFYHPKRLKRRLARRDCRAFLENRGYVYTSAAEALRELRARFRTGCPDEIGIFLGYPPADVQAFSEKREHRYVDYWKCYEHIFRSKVLFFLYDVSKHFVIQRTIYLPE
ncbi:Protein of uncharacterised function (DUF3793) [Aedoeadaptatus ivorii]|uniref:Protein of uncharacterized function (DUF3793) n=1 Tax=Aedoeadaptatus ivorii TaxID=54006 RepID=A0A3S5C218_9FIRM|nr:DUF3793 family protein [Peptoniphilus ivorii]VEJ34416.1 Protein of uncharacterised function (DUF3793) [Peptoniphilus ivorii]